MSEIEKMYENAGIEKTKGDCLFCPLDVHTCVRSYDECPYYYPPFTAEKQIELIKFLMKQEDFSWTISQQNKETKYIFYVGYEYSSGEFGGFKEFTEALAGIINNLWQDLTEEEKQQVKGILE